MFLRLGELADGVVWGRWVASNTSIARADMSSRSHRPWAIQIGKFCYNDSLRHRVLGHLAQRSYDSLTNVVPGLPTESVLADPP